MEYRTGVLRQQTVPGAARPEGVERAERGAGAPDGVVRGDTDGAVVCGRWPCRCAGGKGPPLVCPSGGADVQRYAGCAAAPDVAVPRLRAFGCRGALAGMRRNATPDAFRSGVEVRKTSLSGKLLKGTADDGKPSCDCDQPRPRQPGASRTSYVHDPGWLRWRPAHTTSMLPPSNRPDTTALSSRPRRRASLTRASSLSRGRMISSTPRTSPTCQSLRGD